MKKSEIRIKHLVQPYFRNNNSPIGEVKEQPTFSDTAEQIIWTLSPILVTIFSSLTATCSDWERSGRVEIKHNKAPIICIFKCEDGKCLKSAV